MPWVHRREPDGQYLHLSGMAVVLHVPGGIEIHKKFSIVVP